MVEALSLFSMSYAGSSHAINEDAKHPSSEEGDQGLSTVERFIRHGLSQ